MKIGRFVLILALLAASAVAVAAAPQPASAAPQQGPVVTCADLNDPIYDGVDYGGYADNVTLEPGDTVVITAVPVAISNISDKSFSNLYARLQAAEIRLYLGVTLVDSSGFPTPGLLTYTEMSGVSGTYLEWYTSNELYADWDVSCTSGVVAGCDVVIPLTADAVVGAFVADADAYWAPGKLTSPLVTITEGNTAWVLGVDATGQYYKIVWVCQYLWVQVGTMGPNFDKVWNGTPLPTTVVK